MLIDMLRLKETLLLLVSTNKSRDYNSAISVIIIAISKLGIQET
jgi:hypothetical protein